MNFFKRAITSMLRARQKTAILFVLIFVLGTIVLAAIAVEISVSNTEANLRRGMRPLVSFRQDLDAIDDDFETSGLSWDEWDSSRSHEMLTAELVRQIGALPYVNHYEYSVQISVMSDHLEEYLLGITSEEPYLIGSREALNDKSWLTLQGTSEPELLQVAQGVIEIVEGSSFTEDNLLTMTAVSPAIVSRGFASSNNLSVGSTFVISEQILLPHSGELDKVNIFLQKDFEFEIIGIFDIVAEVDINDDSNDGQLALSRASDLVRPIYVPNVVVEEISRFQFEGWREMEIELGIGEIENHHDVQDMAVNSVMLLNDPLELESFRAEAEALLPDFWVIHDLQNDFEAISTSMGMIQEIARGVLWVSVGTTILVLSLLCTLFLHDRRHELGVYLALGEKKVKISLQILVEIGLTALVSITLSLFTGILLSGIITQAMLRHELVQMNTLMQVDHQNPLHEMSLNEVITVEDVFEAFEILISLETIGLFYGVGLGVVAFSTLIPVLYVIRLDPKKMLI